MAVGWTSRRPAATRERRPRQTTTRAPARTTQTQHSRRYGRATRKLPPCRPRTSPWRTGRARRRPAARPTAGPSARQASTAAARASRTRRPGWRPGRGREAAAVCSRPAAQLTRRRRRLNQAALC
eukprot:362169-Chlamydomonas_euryale.AAC.4